MFHIPRHGAGLCHRLTDSKNATLKHSGLVSIGTRKSQERCLVLLEEIQHLTGTDELHIQSHLTVSPLLTVSVSLFVKHTWCASWVPGTVPRVFTCVNSMR